MPPRKKTQIVEENNKEKAPKEIKRVSLLKELNENRAKMYERYRAVIEFREKVLGGTPLNEKLLEGFLLSRLSKWMEQISRGKATPPKEGSPEEKTMMQLEEMKHQVDLEKEEDTSSCGFMRDDTGFYFQPRIFKAMLKIAGNGLGITRRPPMGAKQDLQHFIHVKPENWKPPMKERIYFLRNDKPISPKRVEDGEEVPNVDGRLQRPIHVDGPQGPRSAIVQNDFFESTDDGPIRMKFEIWILKTRLNTAPSREELLTMLCIGEDEGVGASRSQDFGKFNFVEFDYLGEFKEE